MSRIIKVFGLRSSTGYKKNERAKRKYMERKKKEIKNK